MTSKRRKKHKPEQIVARDHAVKGRQFAGSNVFLQDGARHADQMSGAREREQLRHELALVHGFEQVAAALLLLKVHAGAQQIAHARDALGQRSLSPCGPVAGAARR
mgnify:CR=1 FL=1